MVKKKDSKVKSITITVIIVLVVIAAIVGAYYKGWIKLKMPAGGSLAAKVNGEGITTEELDKQYELFFILVGYPESMKEQITKELYLNQMIVEEMMLQEAEGVGISPLLVTDEELREALDVYIKTNGISSKQLAENLVDKGLTIEDLQEYFKKQIAINKFLNETMLGELKVSDDEVKAYYENNIDQFTAQEGQIRARHILVGTEEEAEEIIRELRGGADFAEMAMERSLDTASGVRGGELGFFTKEMMVKEFGDAAFELTVNKISNPVETEFGWHVIQRQNDKILFDEVKDLLKQQLSQERQRIVLQTYIKQLEAKAEIENYLKEE
ncbi:peptidylprolyl isomerase [Candidatus Woesearchaeota archaeon]|nr:peptidylprolyl isomerase [Candidatus Woesearchaeota archaeon]